jgi:hypothetical protein
MIFLKRVAGVYSEAMRIKSTGELFVNATTSTYGAASGYNLGVKGTSGQTYISIARVGQSLDSQGMILGLDTAAGQLTMLDNLPLLFNTNNSLRLTIASGGAATFTGSVTANGGLISSIITMGGNNDIISASSNSGFLTIGSTQPIRFTDTGSNEWARFTNAGIFNVKSRGNFLNSTDNSLFSLNSGGTLYTVGFSPTATASSTNTLTLTTGTTTWIYTGTGTATWTLPNPSGNNQIYWIKNAGTGAITLTAFSGTNIINNSAASVSTISIAVGATAVIAQDGNVKSYQLQ